MRTKEIGKNLFLIDLKTGGFKNLNFKFAFKTFYIQPLLFV
jgi:hypothetical protein